MKNSMIYTKAVAKPTSFSYFSFAFFSYYSKNYDFLSFIRKNKPATRIKTDRVKHQLNSVL